MLPHRPRAFDPDFLMLELEEPRAAVSQREPEAELSAVDHHCQICPTCSHQLTGHHCKLVCAQCGYYMSCADYY